MPCPFCGTKTEKPNFYFTDGYKYGGVECDNCGARGPDVRTNYDESENASWHMAAILEWNIRK